MTSNLKDLNFLNSISVLAFQNSLYMKKIGTKHSQ